MSLITLSLFLFPAAAQTAFKITEHESSACSSTHPEWYDGWFNGEIQTNEQIFIGSLKGKLNLGKTDNEGSFILSWNSDQMCSRRMILSRSAAWKPETCASNSAIVISALTCTR